MYKSEVTFPKRLRRREERRGERIYNKNESSDSFLCSSFAVSEHQSPNSETNPQSINRRQQLRMTFPLAVRGDWKGGGEWGVLVLESDEKRGEEKRENI